MPIDYSDGLFESEYSNSKIVIAFALMMIILCCCSNIHFLHLAAQSSGGDIMIVEIRVTCIYLYLMPDALSTI